MKKIIMALQQPFKLFQLQITHLFFSLFLLTGMLSYTQASASEALPKIMVLDFQLNDMTGLPNAPEELERIRYLTTTYKQKLTENNLQLVPVNEKLLAVIKHQSATYLFDNIETAAELAADSGADYLLINVALKPTYLFVYPRLLLVDIKTKKVVLAKAAQLESSWSDQSTTARTAEKLAEMVSGFFSNQLSD
ncbi:MAG: DUF2380 domain-containing protein [Methylophilus sp.]|nr:DUF2380 domain-containing protein [Methylophilus sp.]